MANFDYTINDFSVGMRSDADSHDLPPGSFRLLNNLSTDKQGALVTRKSIVRRLEELPTPFTLTTTIAPSAGTLAARGNTGSATASQNLMAQSYIATKSGTLTSLTLDAKTVVIGTPGFLYYYIREDYNGVPSGASIAQGTINYPTASFGVTLSGLQVPQQENQKYWIVIQSLYNTGGNSSAVSWNYYSLADTYANNEALKSIDGGVTWTSTLYDQNFSLDITTRFAAEGLADGSILYAPGTFPDRAVYHRAINGKITTQYLNETTAETAVGYYGLSSKGVVSGVTNNNDGSASLTITTTAGYPELGDFGTNAYVYNVTKNEYAILINPVKIYPAPATNWNSDTVYVTTRVHFAEYYSTDKGSIIYPYVLGENNKDYLKYLSTPTTLTDSLEKVPGTYLASSGNRLFTGRMPFTGRGNVVLYSEPNSTRFSRFSSTVLATGTDATGVYITTSAAFFTNNMVGSYIWDSARRGDLARITSIASSTKAYTDVTFGTRSIGFSASSIFAATDTFYVFQNFFIADKPITGLIYNDPYMLIFDLETAYLFDFNSGATRAFKGMGCVSEGSIAKNSDGTIFWLGTDGIYSISNGGTPQKISQALEERSEYTGIIDAFDNTKFLLASGIIDGNCYYLFPGDPTSTIADISLVRGCLVYNFVQNSWRIEKIPFLRATRGFNTIANRYETIFTSALDLGAFALEDHLGIDHNYNGGSGSYTSVPIAWDLVIEDTALGATEYKKNFDIIIRYKTDTAIDVSLKGDDDVTYKTIGTLPISSTPTTVKVIYGEPTVKFNLHISGSGNVEIYSINFKGDTSAVETPIY